MNKPRFSCRAVIVALAVAIAQMTLTLGAYAQEFPTATGKPIDVTRSTNRVEVIAKTSRMLVFEYDVPELVVDNQNIIRATPIASNKILLTGLKPGIATITASDANKQTQTIDVEVNGDARGLEAKLQQIFPNSRIKAHALETGVVLTGTMARADDVQTVMSISSEYFPTVYNNLKLFNSQLIAIEVEVYEVARTKVRELGIDWSLQTGNVSLDFGGGQTATQGTTTVAFSVVNNGDSLTGFLNALEQRSLARLLDKPTLVTMNGRPAEFLEGGELPFEVNQGLGNTTIEFRPFGTKLDVVPIVQGEGTIRLEIRAEISEPSSELSTANGTPGFRVRRVNTGVDMKIGHTLALAGDIREDTESTISGIPWLMNTPWIGSAFRRVEESKTEIELVILMTPRFIGEVDPALMPLGGPGRNSVAPSDNQFYMKGYTEVPRCGPDCTNLPYDPQIPNRDSNPGYYHSGNGVNSTFGDGQTHIVPNSIQPISPAQPHQPASQTPGNGVFKTLQDSNTNGSFNQPASQPGFGYPSTAGSTNQSRGVLHRMSSKGVFRR